MARIIRTAPKKRKFFLLKAGLSIFLFLQIQMPEASRIIPEKLNTWSFELCRFEKDSCCFKNENQEPHIALATTKQK